MLTERIVIDLRDPDVIAFDRVRKPLVWVALSVLVINFVVLAGMQAWSDAFTFDEPVYAVSGSTALREGDLRINYQHPPLPKVIAAIPAELFADVEIPLESAAWDRAEEWTLATEMYAANQSDVQRITFLYRIVPILLAAVLGLAIYALGRELFGWLAGLTSATLWLTMPVAVGFGHLNGLDIPAALTVVITCWLLARYLRKPSGLALALVTVSVGMALLSRAGVGVVVACAAVGVIVAWEFPRHTWRAVARGLSVAVGGWAIVWIGYLVLDPSGLDISMMGEGTQQLVASDSPSLAARLALIVPWPDGYEAGIRYLAYLHGFGDSAGYLLGRSFQGAPLWFWPASFALKITTVAAVTIIAGLVAMARMKWQRVRRPVVILAPVTCGLAIMMATATRAYGIRYLIPILVIALVVAGAAVTMVKLRTGIIALAVIGIVQVSVLWGSHPSSLAWSNPMFGESWRVAVDSNVDWGQDFYRLKEWATGEDEPFIVYFGFGPSWDLEEIPNAISGRTSERWAHELNQPTGQTVVAVSATELNAYERSSLGLLRNYCPVEKIGESILVYRFEEPPRSLVADHIGRPAGLCEDSEFSVDISGG